MTLKFELLMDRTTFLSCPLNQVSLVMDVDVFDVDVFDVDVLDVDVLFPFPMSSAESVG